MTRKKENVKGESIKEAVERYTQEVLRKNVKCPYGACPVCGEKRREGGFKWAGLRRRLFYLVVNGLVEKVHSFLTRWLCPHCRHRFTYYPPFAVPGKRYVKVEIEERALKYVENGEISYRKASKERNMACGYQDGEKQLSHSTIHRWVSFLGAQVGLLKKVVSILGGISSELNLHRLPFEVHASKYRSQERKKVLQIARKLLHAFSALRALQSERSFPEFATEAVVK